MKKSVSVFLILFGFTVFSYAASASEDQIVAEKISKRDEKIIQAKQEAEKRFWKNSVADEYLGIMYANVAKTELNSTQLRLELANGSFNIYLKPFNSMESAALNSASDSPAVFLLKMDDYVFNLNSSPAVKKYVRQTSAGAQLCYVFEKQFQVAVDFKLQASKKEGFEDGVAFSVFITNLSGKEHTYSLKLLLDTCLGENSSAHFVLHGENKITGETSFDSEKIKESRYFVSSNGKKSLQFMLSGADISSPEKVTFANPYILEKSAWNGRFMEGRAFSSAGSYGNSAVELQWSPLEISSEKTEEIKTLIFTAVDGDECKGLYVVDGLEVPDSKTAVKKSSEKKDAERGKLTPVPLKKNKDEKKTDVEFVVPQIKEYQLDPEYIQNLIDKIDSLQSDSKNVDKKEIARLNAELDAILEVLRQQ